MFSWEMRFLQTEDEAFVVLSPFRCLYFCMNSIMERLTESDMWIKSHEINLSEIFDNLDFCSSIASLK